MMIGGLQRVSLIDYPGKISAIIFTQGCNFRCSYCHNPELVDPDQYGSIIPEEDIFSFLDKRRLLLEAVTVTGGEPTLQPDLEEFLEKVKKLGYLIKMDTNGSHPDILEKVILKKLIDYLAMDIKGPLKKYRQMVSVKVDSSKIRRSIQLIIASGINHEFRTTVVRSQLDYHDLLSVAKLVRQAHRYVLQPFIPTKTLISHLDSETSYTEEEFSIMQNSLQKECPHLIIR